MRTPFTIAIVLLAMLAIPGCRSDGAADAMRIGVTPNYPPVVFRQNGDIFGIEADLAGLLSRELGAEFRWVELPWDGLLPALDAGEIDLVMSGMSVTPERVTRAAFSDPYLRVGQMALVREGDWGSFSDPATWNDPATRLGVESGTTGETYAREHQSRARLTTFTSPHDGVAALRRKEIDLFVHDAPTIWRVVGGLGSEEQELTGIYVPLTVEHLAWAMRRDDDALRARVDAALAALKQDGRLDQVIDRWIPVRKLTVPVDAPAAPARKPGG